jgi:hypothetical protein
MNILIPWFATFIVCIALFLIGLRLQHNEKKKRLKQSRVEFVLTGNTISATTMLRPTSQSAQSAPGIHALEGQSGQRLVH